MENDYILKNLNAAKQEKESKIKNKERALRQYNKTISELNDDIENCEAQIDHYTSLLNKESN